jgi:uncharacterized protein YbjT (DUF2867 family)
MNNLRVMTRRVDLDRPLLRRLQGMGVQLVEGDLDDAASLTAALQDVAAVYCHGLAGDEATADEREVERAHRLVEAAQAASVRHWVYNSAGGADRNSGIPRIEQKHQVEQILQAAELPTTFLRACLFMEEFWKQYTRPGILKGTFRFAIPSDRTLQLVTTRDMGRVAAAVMRQRHRYLGQAIELAGDQRPPAQMAADFSQVQGEPVRHQNFPAWIFLLLLRKELYDLIQWYRHEGYQADVEHLRQAEFPGLLTTFPEFLRETDWANRDRSYDDLGQDVGLAVEQEIRSS